MFALITKLAEILVEFGHGFVGYRRTGKDVDVAAALLHSGIALQDLCVRGDRLLTLAEEMADGAAPPATGEGFADLVGQQAAAITALRSELADSQGLLATVDAALYVELVPFLDMKSGLLTRWGQQVSMSRFSTTTLFFLPAETLGRVIEAGKAHASEHGMSNERTDYLLAVADGIRSARAGEVRDLRLAAASPHLPAVKREIATARDELARAKALCGQLLAATQEAVGPEAMARLRRKLVPKSSRG